jgi:hypothetical protein
MDINNFEENRRYSLEFYTRMLIFLTNLLHALSQTGDGMEVEIDDKALTDTIVELSNVK